MFTAWPSSQLAEFFESASVGRGSMIRYSEEEHPTDMNKSTAIIICFIGQFVMMISMVLYSVVRPSVAENWSL